MAKFDIEKRNKILEVLERAWLHNLKTPASRAMIADLITKELFGDDSGYLNNTAYGDNPITPTVDVVAAEKKKKEQVKQVKKVPTETKKIIETPVVPKKQPEVPTSKRVVSKKKSKSTDLGNVKPKRRMLKNKTTKRSKKDGISRFSK